MSETIRVLGIDLASSSWRNNGAAILEFHAGPSPRWQQIEYGCVKWPDEALTPKSMAGAIERAVSERGIAAVSLDGPQGWREADAGTRPGVGRLCEYEAQCQGKTGEYGRTYPQTQYGWIKFCINVFGELLQLGRAELANSKKVLSLETMSDGRYWLLECFPTSIWRSSGLPKLPGKNRIGQNRLAITEFAKALSHRYEAAFLNNFTGSHDDLQGIVAALPAVGLLGGPCRAIPRGKPARVEEYRVEGLIWDAEPLASAPPAETAQLSNYQTIARRGNENSPNNPIIFDDRDDDGDDRLARGVRLFRRLAELANVGEAVGIGYADFVCCLHGAASFREVANRKYAQSDTRHVLELANQVTEQEGGLKRLTRGNVTIEAGMDGFIWRKKRPHSRPKTAFRGAGYSYEEWNTIFPYGDRKLLDLAKRGLDMASTSEFD